MNSNNTKPNIKERSNNYFIPKVLRKAFFIFAPAFILVTLTITLILSEKIELDLNKKAEKTIIENRLQYIESELQQVINDLFILKDNAHFRNIWDGDSNMLEDSKNDIVRMVTFRGIYDQGRIIDIEGNEIIRINKVDNYCVAVSEKKLQNKFTRYYFQETIKLNNNDIYISPLDLNVENGQIETPHKPMLRISTPLFDKQNNKKGILIFNYLGKNIIEQIDDHSNILLDNHLMLVNKEGYWLRHPASEKNWGFMFENKKSVKFQNSHPKGWDIVSQKTSGQFINEDGLFTFTTVYPLTISGVNGSINTSDKDYYWKIVSHIPIKTLHQKRNINRGYMLLILGLFSLILLSISFGLAKALHIKNIALKSLKNSNDTKDKLFSVIAHDLKGPFNSLLGFSQILLDEIPEADIDQIKKHSLQLNSTINHTYNLLTNLLQWSHSQTNGFNCKPEPMSLKELINEVQDLLELQVAKKNLKLTNEVPIDFNIIADTNILNTVFRNLISNAIKYSYSGGEIVIKAIWTSQSIRCHIIDFGVGIDQETIKHLFDLEKLQSLPGTNNEKGTGLGLILCKELINKHKGTIGVSSNIGEGSNFWFEIPILTKDSSSN